MRAGFNHIVLVGSGGGGGGGICSSPVLHVAVVFCFLLAVIATRLSARRPMRPFVLGIIPALFVVRV